MVGVYKYDNRYNKPLKEVVFLNEGTLTPIDGDTTLGTMKVGEFSKRILMEDEVVPDGLTSDGLIKVKKRTNETYYIAKIKTNPIGDVPTDKSYAEGAYPLRRADAEFEGDAIISVPVKAADTAIAAGNYIKAGATPGIYEVSATPTAKMALGPVTANTTATIPIIDGFRN